MDFGEMDIVSVIVPVYNSEKYLRACIDSIINQSYKNLDIILVDDGSTDSSGRICDEYAEKDSRVNVIHKANGGNGDARNAGLKHVKGKFIVWADNDDVVHSRQVEILLSIAQAKSLDIVVGWYKAIEDGEFPQESAVDGLQTSNVQILTEAHLNNDDFIKKYSMILTVPWGKIYRKKLFEGVQFPAKSKHDDTWTTWKVYEKADKVGFVDEILYFWRNNPNSFGRIFDISHLSGMDAFKEQLEYFKDTHKQRYVEIVYAEYTEMFFWCYNRMRDYSMDLSVLKPYWRYMRRNVRYLKLTKSLGLYMWVKYRYLVYYRIPSLIKKV